MLRTVVGLCFYAHPSSLNDDALIARETRYYAERSDPPAWRSQWVEALD
jgi:hypothetical protein